MELIHFTANWCNPCKTMEPIIKQFLEENPDIIYTKIDVDNNIDAVKMNGIMSVPTFIVKRDSEEVKRHSGAANYNQVNSWFN